MCFVVHVLGTLPLTEWLFLCLQILANVIIFICGNLAGAYHKHLMELALQQTYQDTCNCIKSRIKLEFEKRQQVKCGFDPLPHFEASCMSDLSSVLSWVSESTQAARAQLEAKEWQWHLQTQTWGPQDPM